MRAGMVLPAIPRRFTLASTLMGDGYYSLDGADADAKREALEARGVLVAAGFRQDVLRRYLRVTVGDVASMERFWEAFAAVRCLA